MAGELVRVESGRPLTVTVDGWREYVAVHDAEFLRRRAQLRQAIWLTHPDRGGDVVRCRASIRRYRHWLRQERAYYERRGLTLPVAHTVTSPLLIPAAKQKFERRVTKARQRAMREAFARCGTICGACRAVGVQQSTHAFWRQRDPEYAAAFTGSVVAT